MPASSQGVSLVHCFPFRSSLTGPVLTQNEGARYHAHCHPREQTVDVLIRHCGRLLIELLINLSSCHQARPWPFPASTEVSGKRVKPADEGRVAGVHVLLQMRLVKKRAVGDDCASDGNEDAAANIANEVNDPRNLITRLFRKPDIRRSSNSDERERNREHL